MEIRKATASDKKQVLDFCKNTFSWGDYISDVWDSWNKEGHLLVLTEKKIPVAISHGSIDDSQLWVEGIRVKKIHRQKGFAKKLVLQLERIAKIKKCKISKMLIAQNNKNSLNLAKSLGYQLEDTWNFYSLIPCMSNDKTQVNVASKLSEISELILKKSSSYVRSWRWLPLSKNVIKNLIKEKGIIISKKDDKINAVVILRESDHFDKTLMITLVYGNGIGIKNVLKYIQNFAKEKKYERIQVLSKLKKLPQVTDFEKKFSFHLMKKKL